MALTAGNAFFVAAEFSLVTVDRAEIDQLAAGGDTNARTVRKALRELSFQLSGAQLGITLSALLTGYLAQPALSHLLDPILGWVGGAREEVSAGGALALATGISMLFGELVPKNAAIARPLPVARMTAGPMRAFSTTFRWLIRALNGSANWLVRRLGVQPQEELASARSPEELGMLAAYSAKAGALPEEMAVLLRRTIRFGSKRAAEAMTPRVDVLGVTATQPVQAVIDLVRHSGKSRFPVYEQTLDQIVGVVSMIDALSVAPTHRRSTMVGAIAREPVLVPGSLDLDGVLAALQAAGKDFAIVVDEYGGTDGVVTIEDLVEELVGEIADEHDAVRSSLADVRPAVGSGASAAAGPLVGSGETAIGDTALRDTAVGDTAVGDTEVTAAVGERTWLVDGVLREDEMAELTGFRLPAGPYETLAGYLLARLGRIPVPGESVLEHGWEFTIIEVERRRIEQVRVVAPVRDDDG